jgi:hypothetical protein
VSKILTPPAYAASKVFDFNQPLGSARSLQQVKQARGGIMLADAIQNDFASVVGVINALVFEAIIFMAISVVWYFASGLSALLSL